MHWILLALRRLTEFRGRSRRKEFWAFTAALMGLVLLTFAGSPIAHRQRADAGEEMNPTLLEPHPNHYGPGPKDRGDDHPVFAPPSVHTAAMPHH